MVSVILCYVEMKPTACGLTVRLTVAVPGVRLADDAATLHTDRGHPLTSLYLPPAALGSLPTGLFLRQDPARGLPALRSGRNTCPAWEDR